MKNINTFCETKGKECAMNYCDENGCADRKRVLVDQDDDNTGSGVVSNGIAMEDHPGLKTGE